MCEQFLQLRGIVYPKWSRKQVNSSNENSINKQNISKNEFKWEIDCYSYSFSKHILKPRIIKLKKENNYNLHVQNCPFKIIKILNEKFKIYP